MIKRRFYKSDRLDKANDSDSSSDSDSDSDVPEEPSEERRDDKCEEDDGGDEAVQRKLSPPASSGYESEESSGNEIKCDPSGFSLNDRDDNAGTNKEGLKSTVGGKLQVTKKQLKDTAKIDDSVAAELDKYVLAIKSVFKCRICPRIVCLNEDTLAVHLKSKRHARSKKLLEGGRLKLMLNNNGEVEEDAETHAERHARTLAIAQKTATPKKNKGRQRQKKRRREKNLAGKTINSDPSATIPASKKHKVKG